MGTEASSPRLFDARDAEPTTRGAWSGRSWLLAGPIVGLVGGMVAGLTEPVLRLWPLRSLMTTRLWLEAFSFSLISYAAVSVAACTIACLLGALAVRLNKRARRRLWPGPVALAAFLVGLAVMMAWGQAAAREISLAEGPMGVAWALILGLALLILVAWVCTRFRPTAPGRWAAGIGRIAVFPAVVLAVASLGLQWQGRSCLHPAEGFWPLKSSRPTSRRTGVPPNVVLVVFDTLRADRLGCYGYRRPTSPHIDAFAADAVRFERAISPGTWTEPGHAAIFTGLFRSQHGVGWNHLWLDDGFITLAEALRDCGYQTFALSNNPNVSPGTNLTQGFERFAEPARLSYTTRNGLYAFVKRVWAKNGPLGSPLGRWFVRDNGGHATTLLTTDLLRRRDRSRPFLLFINYMEPHSPHEPYRAYRRSFVRPGDLGRSYEIDQRMETVFQYVLGRKWVYSQRDLRIISDLYDARIRELDDHFADLMRVLAAEVDLDDTLIILTADHGENLGDHELLDHQFCVYNTLVHVPLIVRWPRVLRPQRVGRLVQTSDIFPTVLSWAGAELKQSTRVMARPLAAALESTPESDHRMGFAEFLFPPLWTFALVRRHDPTFDPSPWMVAFRAVFDQQWKLILRSDRRVELYDLSSDPGEEHNLRRTHRTEAVHLRQKLARWRRSFKAFDPNQSAGPSGPRLSDEQVRRLRDLGYLH